MPRLLILCEYPILLGGERSMLATLPAITAAGFEAYVAAPSSGELAAALREHGIPHISWQTRDEAGSRLPLEGLRSDLSAIVRRIKPDLLHANSLSTARIAGPPAVGSGIRSIGHLRDIVKLSNQAIDDLNQHRTLIAVSRATRDFHVAQGLAAEKCVIIHNGVDLDEFQPQPPTGYLHRKLGLPEKARLIATIGQLGLRKGTDVALAAARQVADHLPDVHWLIVGERTSAKDESREFEAQLRRVATQPPLAVRVHFLGQRSDVATLLPECTLLVHAARQEPLGRVLLESAACGLAIVATDVGGTPEIFPDTAKAAILVPPDDCGAVADAVASLLRDPCRRTFLGAAARRRAEFAFDIRIAAQQLVRCYQATLA